MEHYIVDDDHKEDNLDRLITICEEGRMQIHLRRDFNKYVGGYGNIRLR